MGKIKLLHGSDHIIEKPDLLLGKTNNDYGRGFYCTQELSMAMEWACKKNSDGFVLKYIEFVRWKVQYFTLDGIVAKKQDISSF